MVTIPANAQASKRPLTLGEAAKDIVIIVAISIAIIGLVVVLHTMLPPIA